MYCIQESDKPNFMFYLLNRIEVRGDKLILPISGKKIMPTKKAISLAKKTRKVLGKAASKRIVVSENIKSQKEYVNLLHTYLFDIQDGKWLFEMIFSEVLEYIVQERKLKKEEKYLSILVNDLTEGALYQIRRLAKQYKTVNIITNHVGKFKKIEEQIFEKEGIMITVGNNKRKGLARSDIILNIDFPSELINQYVIKTDAILVNIRENVKIKRKRFDGIIINNYEVSFCDNDGFDYEKLTKYRQCEIYEAQINHRQPYEEIMKQIKRDKLKITQLVTS